jgi:hypothetical protein
LRVRDDQGYLDNVRLHQGTIINPTGITLSPGMVVSVDGYTAGSYFTANEIDTPYTFYSGVPYYLGHPWYYYGPTASLNFFFGNHGWWDGPYRDAPVIVNRSVYVHNHAPPYRGGVWRGHNYVAAPQRGGYAPHAPMAHAPVPHMHAGGAHGGARRH